MKRKEILLLIMSKVNLIKRQLRVVLSENGWDGEFLLNYVLERQ